MLFLIKNDMFRIFSDICLYGGLVMMAVSAIISYVKALGDDEVDKMDLFLGKYLFEYPIFAVMFFLGLGMVLLGFIGM
jgi:hypothetical protein